MEFLPKQYTGAISSGLPGRLDYEFSCNRGWLFGEIYAQSIIAEIIGSRLPSGLRVASNVAMPELKTGGGDVGRPREVDLAVVESRHSAFTSAHVRACLEVKWATSSSGYAQPRSILADILRLARIARARPDVPCMFLLAGGVTPVQKVLEKGVLAPAGPRGRSPLADLDRPGWPVKFSLKRHLAGNGVMTDKQREEMRSAVGEIPEQLITSSFSRARVGSSDWTVCMWRIWPES